MDCYVSIFHDMSPEEFPQIDIWGHTDNIYWGIGKKIDNNSIPYHGENYLYIFTKYPAIHVDTIFKHSDHYIVLSNNKLDSDTNYILEIIFD